MAEWQLPAELVLWIAQLSTPLHTRIAGRLLPLLTGMLFAQGRRTVASWLRGAGLDDREPERARECHPWPLRKGWIATPNFRLGAWARIRHG